MVAKTYWIDLDPMIDEVGRIGGQPAFRTIARLEAVLALQFADTQERTHILTGSLKISGRPESDYDSATRHWSASITYGGEAPGAINNPVDYAIYEMARGGDHDFFAGLSRYDDLYPEAINSHFTGDW